jgi:hypothetical protein
MDCSELSLGTPSVERDYKLTCDLGPSENNSSGFGDGVKT